MVAGYHHLWNPHDIHFIISLFSWPFPKIHYTNIICFKHMHRNTHQLIGVSNSQENNARLLAERKRLPLDQVVAKAGWEPLTKALVIWCYRGDDVLPSYKNGISNKYWDNIAIIIRSQIPSDSYEPGSRMQCQPRVLLPLLICGTPRCVQVKRLADAEERCGSQPEADPQPDVPKGSSQNGYNGPRVAGIYIWLSIHIYIYRL